MFTALKKRIIKWRVDNLRVELRTARAKGRNARLDARRARQDILLGVLVVHDDTEAQLIAIAEFWEKREQRARVKLEKLGALPPLRLVA